MNSYCLGGPQKRAEVVDILDRVEDEQERFLIFALGIGENVLDAGIFACLDNCQTALVGGSMAELVKTSTRYRFDGDVLSFGLLEDCNERRCFALARS